MKPLLPPSPAPRFKGQALLCKRLFDLFALGLIVALALGLTYPWIAHPLATSIGHMDWAYHVPGTDFMRSLALSEWLYFAPTTLHEWPLGPSPYLMYPAGGAHGVSFDGLLLGIFVAALRFATRLPLQTAWSVALVLAFVLSGLMTYRFAYRRFGRGCVALALAASATCLPYLQQRAAYHPNLCYVWVMPLAIHLALNFQRKPTFKRALAWSISFPLLALSSSYVLIAGLCFQACASLALAVEWRAWRSWRFWRDARLQALILGWAAGILGVIVVMFPMLRHARGRGGIDPDDLARYSVPLVQYLLPAQESWLGQLPFFREVQAHVGTTWEAMAGGPVAALLLAPLFLLLRRVPGPRLLLGVALFGGLLLTSGPQLKVFHAEPLHHGLPLPLMLLTEISPRFNMIRHPGRMHPMVVYLALFAAGYLLAWLRGAWSTRGRRAAWYAAVAMLLALNLLWSAKFKGCPLYITIGPSPFLQSIAAPPPSRDALAGRASLPGAVLDIPASYYWFSHYNFLQFTHRRPLVWAAAGFFHDALKIESLRFVLEDPQLRFFLIEPEMTADVWNEAMLTQLGDEAFMRKLAGLGIEYVIVHPRELDFAVGTGEARPDSKDYYARIEAAWAGHLVYQDDTMRAYHTAR